MAYVTVRGHKDLWGTARVHSDLPARDQRSLTRATRGTHLLTPSLEERALKLKPGVTDLLRD
jgi:hypothetical protein